MPTTPMAEEGLLVGEEAKARNKQGGQKGRGEREGRTGRVQNLRAKAPESADIPLHVRSHTNNMHEPGGLPTLKQLSVPAYLEVFPKGMYSSEES